MRTKKLITLALLCAIALIIFIIELQIPPIVPIPGVKMGLANIVTLFALGLFSPYEAFLILIVRIILGSVFSGQVMSIAYSLAGGIFCFITMSILFKFKKTIPVWVISIFGAITHNIGQIAAAIVLTSTYQVIYYLPVLIISGIISGAFTGITAQILLSRKIFQNLK